MATSITGTAITVGSIDLTTPLAVVDGGTGQTTIPYINYSSSQATTSGASKTFAIPSGVKRVKVFFNDVSEAGATNMCVRLNNETTGYVNTLVALNVSPASASFTTGFALVQSGAGTYRVTGCYTFTNFESNLWVAEYIGNRNDLTTTCLFASGYKTTSAELSSIDFTTLTVGTLDGGSVLVTWEF